MDVLCKQIVGRCCIRTFNKTSFNSIRRISHNKTEVVTNKDRALEYFDVTYRNVYGPEWPSVRLALLTRHKYFAIMNNYCPNFAANKEQFEKLGCMDIGARYRINCDRLQPKLDRLQAPKDKHNNSNDNEQDNLIHKRKPHKDLDDNELADLANLPALRKYPAQYREGLDRAQPEPPSKGPSGDRLVLPQQHLSPELQAQSINVYVPSDSLQGLEDKDEYTEETDVFEKYRITTKPGEGVTIVSKNEFLHWPEMLTVLGFARGDTTNFPKPHMDGELLDHYALDGASLLPVLMMDLQPGNSVLDMCAAPGGKTLAILQTCCTGVMQSNDKTFKRAMRIQLVLHQFYPKQCPLLNLHRVTQGDGRVVSGNLFDRVLVDALCLTDRHSLVEDENNIFQKMRYKERMTMPELQAELLVAALKQVKVGGSVVYSTCTLSPLQNDGVVHLALHTLWDHTDIEVQVVDVSGVLDPLRFAFKFSLGKYGVMVLPWLPNNYGPMYCAKLIRTK